MNCLFKQNHVTIETSYTHGLEVGGNPMRMCLSGFRVLFNYQGLSFSSPPSLLLSHFHFFIFIFTFIAKCCLPHNYCFHFFIVVNGVQNGFIFCFFEPKTQCSKLFIVNFYNFWFLISVFKFGQQSCFKECASLLQSWLQSVVLTSCNTEVRSSPFYFFLFFLFSILFYFLCHDCWHSLCLVVVCPRLLTFVQCFM